MWMKAESPHFELLRKKIFLLFEGGYEFEKQMIIQLWMALELLTGDDMEENGAKYFEMLVSEGYIQRSVANTLYKVNIEKLNTPALDLIKGEQNCAILDNGNWNNATLTETTTLHISVIFDDNKATVFKTLQRFKKLKTLLFLGDFVSTFQQLPVDLFLRHKHLVALDLSGTHVKEMPTYAEEMIHLRYLDLSWTFIELLPERICSFKELQTLKLKGCSRLQRLPNELKCLIELRHLDLDVLEQLICFPKGIGALEKLRTLSAFPVGTVEGLKITELKNLNKLTGEFCIAKLEKVQSASEANEASLGDKTDIKKLKLRWSDYQCKKPTREDEHILENLHPNTKLEEIHIVCYPGTNLPSWIADESFTELFSITLFRCEQVSILPALGKLPSLKALELIRLNSVTKMEYRGAGEHVAFPKLQKLVIEEMLNVESWEEAQKGDDYPSLIMLDITDCPKLPEIPILPYLSSIEHFEISGCNKLAFLSERVLPSSLKQLIVEDCPLIEEKCSKETGKDWHKIQHVPTIWIDQVVIQTINSPKQPTENEKDDEQDLSLQNLETERQKDVEQDHSTLQNLEIASQTDDEQDYLSLQNLDKANQKDIEHDHSTVQNLENASQKEEITLSPLIPSQRHKLPRKRTLSVQRFSWRSIFSCYNILDEPLVPKPKAIKQATDQFHRLGINDFSNPNSLTLSEDLSISLAGSNIHRFSLQEVKLITQSFSSSNFLGEGGFGRVHKGFIDDRVRPGLKAQPVAVKLLDLDGAQGHHEWLAEVTFLGQLRNPHLVKLIGYCCEDEHRLLVYEYMPRGSLENLLFRRTTASLPWLTRIKIALGAAKGLAFLHEAEIPVIYLDFKTSKILLDSDFTAKLSDFGLVKNGPKGDDTHVSTRVMGMQAYAAPEYIMTGHLTAASDVYSFGVVLLELLTGRRSMDKVRSAREQNLAEWARPQLNNPKRLSRIMDPRLEGQYSEAGARKAAALACQCLSLRPKNRPTMTVAVKTLEPLMTLDDDIPSGPFVYTAPTEHKPQLSQDRPHRILTLEKENKPQLKKGMEDH